MESEREALKKEILERLVEKTGYIKRKAQGMLKHDYLVPEGPYFQQWDWDAFFMGMALSSWIPSEAVYLKNITLNILEMADEEGFCPGCLTPDGPSKTLKHIKPFTAQGAFIASEKLGDYSWIEPYYEKLKKIVLYRQKHYWHEEYGLASWWDAMESGADNNIAIQGYKENTVLAPDLNTYIFLEYKAFANIARSLGYEDENEEFLRKAEQISENINKYLWCREDKAYYTFDTVKKTFIKRISFSSMIPLWARLAPMDRAKVFIEGYMLKPEKLWSDYGIRSLSRDDLDFNQANIIKPCSNWQGPVWPIANYLHCHSLSSYGYKEEALENAQKVIRLCIKDLDTSGGMHENYNSETGEPLAAPGFASWNMLLMNLIGELEEDRHPLDKLI
jgi:alpha,alpha-trehalase